MQRVVPALAFAILVSVPAAAQELTRQSPAIY